VGKKRIVVLGEEDKSKKEQKIVKSGKQHGRIADVSKEMLEEAEIVEKKEKELEKEIVQKSQKVKKETKPTKTRSQRYLEAKKLVDPNKFYNLSEAIKLLKKISISRFNGHVDVHLNVKEVGLKGEVEFPHPTGKAQVIRIADEPLIKELEEGKINFTLLIATPKMMSKLAKFAKILGPRGLMPNPKAGTISENPQEVAKNLAQKTQFRTEPKAPLIHLSLGKINDEEKNLEENFKALIKAVGKRNIKKAVLAPTMGPGIKIDLSGI
jgi:large subunit ribosomal protein L1